MIMPELTASSVEKQASAQKIEKNIKSGSLEEAKEIRDAVAEAGNIIVGSWDRIFREKLDKHKHFKQTNTFIGNPWDEPEQEVGLAPDEELLFVPYKITAGSSPAFDCGVILPKAVFSDAEADEKPGEAEIKAGIEAEEEAKAKAEMEAEAQAREKAVETEDKTAEQPVETEQETSDENKTEAEELVVEDAAEVETEAEETSEPTEPTDGTEPAAGSVSETIQTMAQSPANLPGGTGPISLAVCAKYIMQKDVVWSSGEDSVQQALAKMQQAKTGYMLVGTDGHLEGIVSKSDITGAVSIYLRPIFAKWHRPLDDATLQIKIKWIMTRPVRTIGHETPLAATMDNMLQFDGRCLPVVDQQDKVQGLVTASGIYQALLSGSPNNSYTGKAPQAPPLAELDLSVGKEAQDAK